jgi:hypothetical protein
VGALKTTREILKFLLEHNGKVTGSYARGEQTRESDLDIYVPEKEWAEVREVLRAEGFGTTAIGQWNSFLHKPRLEVSWRFFKQPKKIRLPLVTVAGVTFKTW